MDINFDIKGARQAGASDKDISDYFKSKYSVDFDVEGARKAGASDDDILGYINTTYSQKKSQNETTSGSKEATSKDGEPQLEPSTVSGTKGEVEVTKEVIAPIDLPTSYTNDRNNKKDLKDGGKYNLLRGGKPIVGTWDAANDRFIKDKLIDYTPQEKAGEGFIEKASRVTGVKVLGGQLVKTDSTKPPKETEEEAFARATAEAEEIEKDVVKKVLNADYLTSYPQLQQLQQLKNQLELAPENKKAEISAKINELRVKKLDSDEFVGTRLKGDEEVYQNFMPAPRVGEELVPTTKDGLLKLPKTDMTIGEAYDEVVNDGEYVADATQEIQNLQQNLIDFKVSKLPEVDRKELDALRGTAEYDEAVTKKLAESEEVSNWFIAGAFGLKDKIDAIIRIGEGIGVDDEEAKAQAIRNIKRQEIFGIKPKTFGAEMTYSVGGMLPDIVAGRVYPPAMLVSIMSTMPSDFIDASVYEDYVNGRPIDMNKARKYATASTIAQGGLLMGAGKIGSHGLKIVGETNLVRSLELMTEMAKRGGKDAVLFGTLGHLMQNKINKAFKLAENDDYLKQSLHMAVIGMLFAFKEGSGKVIKLPNKAASEVDYLASYLPRDYTQKQVEQFVQMGKITASEGEAVLKKLDDYRLINAEFNDGLTQSELENIYLLWLQKMELKKSLVGQTSEMASHINGQIKDLDRKILIASRLPLTSEEKLEKQNLTIAEATGKPFDKYRLDYLNKRAEKYKEKQAELKAEEDEYKAKQELAKKAEEAKKVAETPQTGNVGVGGDTKPTPTKMKVLGQEVNLYNDYIPTKVEDVEPSAMYVFNGNSKSEIPFLLQDKAYVNKREVNGVKSENWHASISGEELIKLYPKEQPVAEAGQEGTTVPKVKTEKEITLFKGQMGKLNADGTKRTAHPNAEGFFTSESEDTAKRYSGEDAPQKITLPKGVTIEEVQVADRNKPMSEIRREEENLINKSKAQVVVLKTIDAKGEEVQYIVKDKTLLEGKATPSDIKSTTEPTKEVVKQTTSVEPSAEVEKTNFKPNKVLTGANKLISKVADGYKKATKLFSKTPRLVTKVSDADGKRIADAFNQMKHEPNNPEVKKGFEQLITEIKKQADALIKEGFKFELVTEGKAYNSDSKKMLDDVKNNKRILIEASEGAFGTKRTFDQDNIGLQDSGYTDVNGRKLTNVELIRAVHDLFGHSEYGNGFGAIGEENAWRVHMSMFTPLAQKALTATTRGQNSWVNFGNHMRNADGSIKKKGDAGYLEPNKRPFAEQKIGFLPDWAMENAYGDRVKINGKEIKPTNKYVVDGKEVYEIDDAQAFFDAISSAKESRGDDGIQVALKTKEEYQKVLDEGGVLLVSKDGNVGVMLEANGNVGSGFAHSDVPKGENSLKPLLITAIKLGGRFTDAYEGYLPKYYAKFGFKPLYRMKFNPEFADKGWDKTILKSEPDVVFMYFDGNRETLEADYDKFPAYDKTQGEYVTDYDKATEGARAKSIEIEEQASLTPPPDAKAGATKKEATPQAGSVGVGGDVKQQELDAQRVNKEAGVDIYVARQVVDANGTKYTLSQINENGNTNTFVIEDANGNEIGKAQLSVDGNFLENIRIDEKHRRRGLASKVYDFIELRKGIELEPSPNKQSKEAKALWDNRNLKKVTEQSLKEAPQTENKVQQASEQVQKFKDVLDQRTDKKTDKALKAFGEQAEKAKELIDNYDTNLKKLEEKGVEVKGTKEEILADMLDGKYDEALKSDTSIPSSKTEIQKANEEVWKAIQDLLDAPDITKNNNFAAKNVGEKTAEALDILHKALVNAAKAYLKAGGTSLKQFAKNIGLSAKNAKQAWDEAMGLTTFNKDNLDYDLADIAKVAIRRGIKVREKLLEVIDEQKTKTKNVTKSLQAIRDFVKEYSDRGNLTRADYQKILDILPSIKNQKTLDKAALFTNAFT